MLPRHLIKNLYITTLRLGLLLSWNAAPLFHKLIVYGFIQNFVTNFELLYDWRKIAKADKPIRCNKTRGYETASVRKRLTTGSYAYQQIHDESLLYEMFTQMYCFLKLPQSSTKLGIIPFHWLHTLEVKSDISLFLPTAGRPSYP